MAYQGIIKKSRTLDLAAISQIVDVIAPIWVLYSPEQIGISVPVYIAVRMLLNGLAVYLRHVTTGPIGEK